MPRPFKIETELSDSDRQRLMRLVRDPAATVDTVHLWLWAHDCRVARSTAALWLRKCRTQVIRERLRTWLEGASDEELRRAVMRLGLDKSARDSRVARDSRPEGIRPPGPPGRF